MTHHPIKVLEDGRRKYSNGTFYTPMKDEVRTNKISKPDDPTAIRFHTKWIIPHVFLEDTARRFPETRPDDDAYYHMDKQQQLCQCEVCLRPQAQRYRDRWLRERY